MQFSRRFRYGSQLKKRFFCEKFFSFENFQRNRPFPKFKILKMCNMILTSELLRKRSRENEHLQCKMGHFWTKFRLEPRNDQFRKKSKISLFLFKIELKFSKFLSTWNFWVKDFHWKSYFFQEKHIRTENHKKAIHKKYSISKFLNGICLFRKSKEVYPVIFPDDRRAARGCSEKAPIRKASTDRE